MPYAPALFAFIHFIQDKISENLPNAVIGRTAVAYAAAVEIEIPAVCQFCSQPWGIPDSAENRMFPAGQGMFDSGIYQNHVIFAKAVLPFPDCYVHIPLNYVNHFHIRVKMIVFFCISEKL